jgi:esterase/lipase superfamily enzyme
MEMLVFGHSGARMLAFPTSMGRFFEWEDFRLIDAMRHQLDNGWIQIFCVDGVDSESWYAKWKHPHDRAVRHEQYDAYLRSEAVPFTAWRNPNPFLMTVGPSFGAYQALAFAFRHPDVVNRAIGLSGLYDIKRMTDGYSDEAVYFSNPMDFIVHENDQRRLDALRRMDIVLAIGRDDPARPNNEELSGRLWAKQIPHALRIWDGWAHDWPYWGKMLNIYVAGGSN